MPRRKVGSVLVVREEVRDGVVSDLGSRLGLAKAGDEVERELLGL